MSIANKLKNSREISGLSVSQVANSLNVSESFVENVELGKAQPTPDFLDSFCSLIAEALKLRFLHISQAQARL